LPGLQLGDITQRITDSGRAPPDNYPWRMTRTYDFDLATGEFVPVFLSGDLRLAETDWTSLAAGVDALIESAQQQLAAALGPILESVARIAEFAERELARTIDSVVPQLQAFGAVLLAATGHALAAIEPAPAPLALTSVPETPEPPAAVARPTRLSWLGHPYWNGINGIGALLFGAWGAVGTLIALLLFLDR
jgi:hypothetical protein